MNQKSLRFLLPPSSFLRPPSEDWMADELRACHRQGLHRRRRRLTSAQGAQVEWRGREFVNFSANDYLGLAADRRLAVAAARAALRFGTGAGASPLVSGHLAPVRALERDLAEWEGTESALVFSSGFVANLAVVSSLARREDAVFSDEHNHASLIDGVRLSRARVVIYRHRDAGHLEELLRSSPPARRRLIVSDSVFSMDGDLAPLADLLSLAQRYEALVVLDEAHATGVLGEQGRGLTEVVGALRQSTGEDARGTGGDDGSRLFKVGTLSKAVGAQGGFVAGRAVLIDWLVNHARPYIFSTALAPPVAAAARQGVRIIRTEPERRKRLLSLAKQLRPQLRALGLDTGASCCQIVPVIIGAASEAVALSRRLARAGLLVPAIRPPSVPEGTSRLRISLSAEHTEADVQRLVEALRRG